ncbi:MAG TPA: glycosyltransferase family 2 protein [Cytophagaceae bacterium]|jgi:GT2 family glycosyltransferase|nr:glycosyltransferase family 2 protein [Cytophagaceae bacterium]
MSKVAVAILNWNGLAHLQAYLPDVVANSPQATVYLIDNGSTDDSVQWVATHYPDVVSVLLETNHGFCEGYNLGLSQLQEPFFILLNSDVRVTPDWIAPLLQLMETQLHVAACQPKILDVSHPNYFEYAGANGGFLDRFGFPFCRGRIFQTLEKDTHQYDDAMAIHWASGAALMIRSNLFHSHGGFDSRLFAHMEEIDLCWRLRNSGHSIYSCPQSVVYHLGGGTLSADNPRKTFLNVRNNLLMLNKNIPAAVKWKVLPTKLTLDGIAGIYFLLQGKWRNTLSIIKGHFAFYLSASPHAKHTSAKGKQESYAQLYSKSIVWEYYIKGKKKYSDLK